MSSSTNANANVNVKTLKQRLYSNKVLFWSPDCRYEVILNNVKSIHRHANSNSNSNNCDYQENDSGSSFNENCLWKLIDDNKLEPRVNIYWIDVSTIHERFRSIQPWQIINHFPGMPNIARKNRMGQNLNKMLKLFPKEYAFYPKTWVLPGELNDFKQQFDSQGNSLNNKIFIIKPDTGCQGRGIFLTKTFENVPQNENVVAQVYIKKPMLLDGFKFDLRLYCFVTSVKPLRMYLFQDGLVRMCTEEYVKPNKHNLAMACMHLTNYAVNKHNDKFMQPGANDGETGGDDAGSKRTLKWFMNHVTQEYGEAKAAWLWRRMGTLCVRSILSIIPTLSREYDQHFKSFSGVATIPQPLATSVSDIDPKNSKYHSSSGKRPTRSSKSRRDDSEEEDSEEDDDENASIHSNNSRKLTLDNDVLKSSSASMTGTNTPNPALRGYPEMRGSRCFEVLGFDVMIDSNLKPWIIEVNHLPSFGTDSPLDLDVKDRLMRQVLAALPALPDDETAYSQHHKLEANRRLMAAKEVSKENLPASAPSGKKTAPAIMKKPVNSRRLNPVPTNSDSPELLALNAALAALPPGLEPVDTGICSPERLQEVKVMLQLIYTQHCPEKVNKIDRLLARYEHREEEFLKYVYSKYGITPPWVLVQQQREDLLKRRQELLAAEQLLLRQQQQQNNIDNSDPQPSDDVEGEGDVSRATSVVSQPRLGRTPQQQALKPNRAPSRSLSPPASSGRVQPVWKLQVEEEEAFRREVMQLHYPREDDEWMCREMKFLTQFTRIFPPANQQPTSTMHSNSNAANTNHDEDEDDDNDADDDNNTTTTTNKYKPASYADIMYQVFLQDKRQTLRLRCPLPRLRHHSLEQDAQLPPLDTSKGHLYNSIAANIGKKSVGWKLPPTINSNNNNNAVVKVPTQSQLDAAARLSKGLSVSADLEHKYLKQRKPLPPKFTPPSVVMDPRGSIPLQHLQIPGIVTLGAPGAVSVSTSSHLNFKQTGGVFQHYSGAVVGSGSMFGSVYSNHAHPGGAVLEGLRVGSGLLVAKPVTVGELNNHTSNGNGNRNNGSGGLQHSNVNLFDYNHIVRTGPSDSSSNATDLAAKEVMLKQLFPGWF